MHRMCLEAFASHAKATMERERRTCFATEGPTDEAEGNLPPEKR